MKGIYINLARRPDRNEHFLRTNPFLQGFQRIEGVEGRSIHQQALLELKLIQEPLKAYSPGALGNALSHKIVWDMCISEDQPVTVAEDDAVFNHGFHEKSREVISMIKGGWDIILWGWNFDSVLHVEVIEGIRECVMNFDSTPLKQAIAGFQAAQQNSIPLRLLNAFGLVCYSVSPKGAERLTALCFPLRNELIMIPALGRGGINYALDIVMNKYYRQINAYVSFPPLVWTENDKSISDVHPSSSA